MKLNHAWVFHNKRKKKIELYGSIRKMYLSEEIIIGGKKPTEQQLYQLLSKFDKITTKDFVVENKEILRTKANKNVKK